MKTVNVRQLRYEFGVVLGLVEGGGQVRISKRGRIVALLSPPPLPKAARSRKRPDFAARLKSIFGGKILRGDAIIEEREARHY